MMAVFSSLVRFAVAVGVVCSQGSLAAQDTAASTAAVFTKSSRPAHERILHPVLNQDADTTNLGNLLPTTNVTLNWGSQGNGLVKVAMVMGHPAVLLEEVDDIASVDCEAASVSVAFGTAEGFDEALADWSDNGDFILVTNHLGDCDTDNERGFYLVQAITANKETRTVVASAHRTDVNNTASSLEITFSSIPVPQSKRITLDPDFTISNSFSLPAPLPLASLDPYISVVANKADLDASITLSGHLKYSILQAHLSELSFDIDASTSANVGLTAEIKAAYKTTVKFAPPALTFSFVNVPGIVSIGPALAFAIGADLGAEAGAAITADLGVGIPAGNVHLDFLDASKSSATGWEPKFTAEANITEKIAASIDPFAEVTVELQFELLSGLVDLSGGITARPGFNNDFILTATQPLIGGEKNGSTTAAYHRPRSVRPRAGEGQIQCAQGLEIKSEFEFSIIAFVTQFFRTTLFHTTVPIVDKCFAF